jgi:4-hydroxy-tetrahydrodipicolinate reductase
MLKIILSGCAGSMGRTVAACAAERKDDEIVAGIDIKDNGFSFPVFPVPEEVNVEADALIDFSNPSLLSPLLDFGISRNMPLVLCTTGYSREQISEIQKAAAKIPIFFSGNMSIGVNLLIELSKKAEQVLGDSFDIEIIEKHHNRKLDAPSGTALMIADALSSVRDQNMHYVYDRHSQRKARESTEIGIHSVRGGTIVGEHDVIFAGLHEVITLSHSAQSRDIFALGALHAAEFLSRQANGLYNMSDLLK